MLASCRRTPYGVRDIAFAASCWKMRASHQEMISSGSRGSSIAYHKRHTNRSPAGSRRLRSAVPMLLLLSLCNARNGLTSTARSKWASHSSTTCESRLSGVQNRRPDLLERYGVVNVSLRTDRRADLERPSGNSSDLVIFRLYSRLVRRPRVAL